MAKNRRRSNGSWWLQSVILLACLATNAANGQQGNAGPSGWRTEEGVEIPSYAVVEPMATNLNVDVVVLVGEQAEHGRILQFQLYLSGEGPLRPIGMSPSELKGDPQAQISIGAWVFPAALVFADDHAVLADDQEGQFLRLSGQLINALQTGQTMMMHFYLGTEKTGERPASFDGLVTVDLQAGGAREAIAAVRRCAGPEGSVMRLHLVDERRQARLSTRSATSIPVVELEPANYREHALEAFYH